MQDRTKKELRRQLVHALGIALVPLALAFGKFFVGAASLILSLIIFFLAEHRNNISINQSQGRSLRLTAAKKSADKSGIERDAVKTAPANQAVMVSSRNENQVISNSSLIAIHNVFEKFERSGGNYRGAFYFYLASAVSLFLFSQTIALLSITVLALGDSLSTAAGIFGKKRIFYNRKKTWEGTLAGFAAAFAGSFLISPQLALPAVLVGMLVESLPLRIDDNLTVPIITGLALSAIAII